MALSQDHPTMIPARIWPRLPYAGHIGESIVNRKRKLKHCFKEPVCLKFSMKLRNFHHFAHTKIQTLCILNLI